MIYMTVYMFISDAESIIKCSKFMYDSLKIRSIKFKDGYKWNDRWMITATGTACKLEYMLAGKNELG